jgi:hypothetical protein
MDILATLKAAKPYSIQYVKSQNVNTGYLICPNSEKIIVSLFKKIQII